MVTVSVWGIGVGGRSLQGEVRAGTRDNPDARAARRRLTGTMLKLIGIAAVVVIGIVLLGHLAKAVLWIALLAILLFIGRAAYQTFKGSNRRGAQ